MSTLGTARSNSGIENLFRRCVVRIPGRGTGFFVLPNCVLTCAHLFDDDHAAKVDVVWQNHSGIGVVGCLRSESAPKEPDLAWLEIRWNGDEPADHPCVMLADDIEREDTFTVFGHPKSMKFEVNGDSGSFRYSGVSSDQNEITYIKMSGDRTTGGYSGSPVLNLRTRKVCGLLAMSLNLNAAEGGRMLPITYALKGFPGLSERSNLYHLVNKDWPELLPGGQLWKQVKSACETNVREARVSAEKSTDDFYISRELEREADRFLESESSAMVIIGESGMGKTTLVNRLLCKYSAAGHLCAMFESRKFTSIAGVESQLLDELAPRSFSDIDGFFAQIASQCNRENKYLVIFVDAANEFNQANQGSKNNSAPDRPIGFVAKLDRIISSARAFPKIKFLLTSRPEIWRKALESARNQFENSKSLYYRQRSDEIAHRLPKFSGFEVEKAFEKYQKRWNITTQFHQLSELAKYLLRDPFFLSLTTEVYEQRQIPPDLNTGDVFAKYKITLGKNEEGFGDDRDLIEDILDEMFAKNNSEVVARTVITRDFKMRESNRKLYDALARSEASSWSRLKERSVLRELNSIGDDGNEIANINFTYDRFAEFLLSHKLKDKILAEAKASPRAKLEDLVTRAVGVNLEGSQQMTVVWGALQQTLLLLQKQKNCDYAKLLQRISEVDARGLSLVVSVLARTAGQSDGGLEVLETLLKNLEGGRKPIKGLTNRFPIIDTVYRVLRNDEYRAWLADQKPSVRKRHFGVLHGYFRWGFCHLDGAVSATAVQYLFFLWRGKQSLTDATTITDEVVTVVRPFSLFEVIRATDQVRVIPNIAGLMVLSLAELQEDDRSRPALALATQMIRNLQLQKSTVFRLLSPLKSTICRYVLNIMDRLQNPIKLKALESAFANFGPTLQAFEEVMGFVRPGFDLEASKSRVRELSHSGSSYVLQMLCFALSVCFERQSNAEDGEKCLAIMEEQFHERGAPATTRYCISLALYHINYFGDKATRRSMEIMGEMASVILRRDKGVFELDDEVLNFNVVGTYGRALYKNGYLLSSFAKSITQRPFQYAIDAIEQAKQIRDFGYYVYVCENIGLLGVLIEPSQVFDVISHIFRDLDVLPRESPGAVPMPFKEDEKAEARATVLQSLANIRVLYRQEVDKYLLDQLESADLYAEVANKLEARFDISTFYSWAFEQLLFRVLTKYYSEMGKDMVTAFVDGARSRSPKACLELVVERIIDRVNEISG